MNGPDSHSALAHELQPGQRYGKYELLEKIGAGGMAEIYKARVTGPEGFEKILVVKRILPTYAKNTAFIEMLIAEAKLSSLLQHANIVQIFELGQIDGGYHIAMEYVHGADLLKLLAACARKGLQMPLEIGLFVVAEAAKGLAYAHAATDHRGRPLNIIHRDVSPSNILISLDGDVKVMDFGVARADLETSGKRKKKSSALKGKLGYMSPELVVGDDIDHRSDIFAMGIILWEILTLRRLFLGKTDIQTLINIRDVRIDKKLEKHSYVPDGIQNIIRKALAKDPDERYQTGTDLQEAILDYLFEHRIRVTNRNVAQFMREALEGEEEAPRPIYVARPGAGEAADDGQGDDEIAHGEEDAAEGADEAADEAEPHEAPADEERDEEPAGGDAYEDADDEALDDEPTPVDDAMPALLDAEHEVGGEAAPEVEAAPRPVLAAVPAPEPEAKAAEPEAKVAEPEAKATEPEAKADEPEPEAKADEPEPEPEAKAAEPEAKGAEPEAKAAEAEAEAPAPEPAAEATPAIVAPARPTPTPAQLAEELRGSSFRVKGDDATFGPITYNNLLHLLRSRSVSPRELISVDGGPWMPISESPLPDIEPAVFEVEPEQPLYEGPVSQVRTPQLLYELAVNKVVGKLKLMRGMALKEIYFQHGVPVHINSNIKSELLANFMLERNLIQPPQINAALGFMKERGGRLGDALVSMGLLKPHDLYRVVEFQFRQRFLEVFAWKEGWYEFLEGYGPPDDVIPLGEDAIQLLTAGVRTQFDLATMRDIFSDYLDQTMVMQQNPHITHNNLRLNSRELRFYTYLETGVTLREVLERFGRNPEDRLTLLQVIFVLHQTDLLVFRSPRPQTQRHY